MATYLRKTGGARSKAGAVLTVDGDAVGFPPKHVVIVNESNGARFEWFESMGHDHGLKQAPAGALTMLTSDGLTPTYTGFELAADIADINDADGELLSFIVTG
jgi:hypothetical protein